MHTGPPSARGLFWARFNHVFGRTGGLVNEAPACIRTEAG